MRTDSNRFNLLISRLEWKSEVVTFIKEKSIKNEEAYHAIYISDSPLEEQDVPKYLQSLQNFKEEEETKNFNLLFYLKLRGGNQVFGAEGSFSLELSLISQEQKRREEEEKVEAGSRIKFVYCESIGYQIEQNWREIFSKEGKAGSGFLSNHFEFVKHNTLQTLKTSGIVRHIGRNQSIFHFLDQEITPNSFQPDGDEWSFVGKYKLVVEQQNNDDEPLPKPKFELLFQQYHCATFAITGCASKMVLEPSPDLPFSARFLRLISPLRWNLKPSRTILEKEFYQVPSKEEGDSQNEDEREYSSPKRTKYENVSDHSSRNDHERRLQQNCPF